MSPLLIWFSVGIGAAALVLGVSIALLRRSLRHVLTDLLGSPARARYFTFALCAVLTTITLTGGLWSAEWIDLSASSRHDLLLNTSKQFLAAGGALLLGLGAAGSLLLALILKFEARRA